MKKNSMSLFDGPVFPIPTFFLKDYSIDWDGLKRYCSFLVNNGVKNVMTTVGTSRFNLLSLDEINEVNKLVISELSGKAYVITSTAPFGHLETTIENVRVSDKFGANASLVVFPDRNYGDNYVSNFFKSIANKTEIDLFVHAEPIKNGLGGGNIKYSISLLNDLFKNSKIIGLKEESLDIGHSQVIYNEFAKKAILIGAGGSMSRFVRDSWFGAKTYLAGIGNFLPSLELDFYEAISQRDFDKAKKIVNNQEIPYFNTVVPCGWHPALKYSISCLNLDLTDFERCPMMNLSDEKKKIIDLAMSRFLGLNY